MPIRFSAKAVHNLSISAGCIVGFLLMEMVIAPAPAQACFYWQECAQQRGQASNTRGGGKRTGLILGGNDATVPYVITPRNAWIGQQSLPEKIRWNAVEDISDYTVRIWQWTYGRDAARRILWQESVSERNEIAFPELPLQLGIYYSVEVMTAEGVSSNLDEGYYQSGFQLLAEQDYELARTQAEQVGEEIAPTAEEAALAQASVYFLAEMYADALHILETLLPNTNSSESANASDLVYIALGDTYSATGLNQLSIEAYEEALALSITNEDAPSTAITQVSLADVHIRLGEFETAKTLLIAARETYQQLDAQTEVAWLNQRISLFEPSNAL
ncbi:MAG: tetratricopeptide repeat protein [Cyanobacteria bacterium J06621_11]